MTIEKIKQFFHKPFFTSYITLYVVWIACAVYTAFKSVNENNCVIFRQSFWHIIEQKPLYIPYPSEYLDLFLYGSVFTYIAAPFAVLPLWLGHLLWQIALASFLFWAIRKSGMAKGRQLFMLWFCANELLTALFLSQFNIAIAAFILLAFCLTEKEKDIWATLFIAIGTITKLYGVVGLAFFLFSRHKVKFVASYIVWMIILILLPILISSPDYIMEQYSAWLDCLTAKNTRNLFAIDENICLLGMVRKISGCATYSDLWLIIPGMILMAIPCLRFSQYKNKGFRETMLAAVLMFVVLFSTGSESYGYITAMLGVVIWYTACPWKRGGWDIALMVFVFILTSLSPGDLFPRYLRDEYVKPYALKALPVTIVWLRLCYEMIKKDYTPKISE